MAMPPPDLDGVSHRQVEVGGVRLHVAEAGSGPPVLLLHGWPQHWWIWRKVLPELAAERRVICPDLRGFGWSDAPAGPYELGELAADVAGLLDVLDLDRVELVGHDWGGYAGFLLCLRAPERIRHYLALGIAHPWIEPPRPSPGALRRFGYQFLLATPGVGASILRHVPSFVETVLKKGAHPDTDWTDAELACYSQSFRSADRALASSHLYRSFLRREVPRLRSGHYRSCRLTVPTLLLIGEADPVVRLETLGGFQAHAEEMAIEVVERSGHFVAEERPDLVLARARELFDPVGG
jgi:pimeloyl-ACP methyl ester carboxylesterase